MHLTASLRASLRFRYRFDFKMSHLAILEIS